MQQKMITAFFVFEMIFAAPMSEFKPEGLFEDTLSGASDNDFKEIQTTAVPDLPDFLFKQFGHPPLTDNQILAILIGSTAIPAELMTEAMPTEQTTNFVFDDEAVTESDNDVIDLHKLEVELIEQVKEVGDELRTEIDEKFKELKNTEEDTQTDVEIHIASSANIITSTLGMATAIILALL